jgi:DNA primase
VSSGSSDFKSQVLQATNIVDLIGQSVALKKRGKDWVGLCPFHQEKSPSFHVSEAKQFFHCYGCKAGGNAIDFVMTRDRLEFVDAMKMLGERAGLEMPQYGMSKQKSGERQILLDAHSQVGSLYQRLLAKSPEAQAARDYLAQRGFNADSITKFQIGFAPNAWDTVLRAPEIAKKFNPQELALAGLVKPRQSGSGYYDTFRNRLMFPIKDEASRVIAFGGRVMPGSDDPAKYLNSPETPLFSKSRSIFGIDLARQKMAETRTVAVVEGYTDVIMAHQYGCSNVVSILGTAMTEQHVNILRRFVQRIVLLFDADTAGDAAVDKAVSLFLTQPVEIVIASIPEDLDPDEYVLKYGADAFDNLLASATDALAYKWKQMVRRFLSHEGDLTGQQKAIEEYLTALSEARAAGPVDSLRWGAALARVSKLTDIPVDELNRRFRPRPGGMAPKRFSPAPDAPPATAPAAKPKPKGPTTAQDRVEREILGLLLSQPSHWFEVQQHVHLEDFTDPERRRLAEVYWDYQRNEGEPVFSELLNILKPLGLVELGIELVENFEAMEQPDVAGALRQDIEYLARARRDREGRKAVAKLRGERTTSASAQDEDAVLRQLSELANQRKKNF